MRKYFLYFGGTITFCLTFVHLSFWKLGNWQVELSQISTINKSIMQMLNVFTIYTVLFTAFISFYLAKKEEFAFIEKSLVIFISGYYSIRFIFGFIFFETSTLETGIRIICLIVAICYLLSLRKK